MKKEASKKYCQTFDTPDSLSDRNLQKILKFYLLNCPVPGRSVRGKTFCEYGFVGTSSFSKLKKALLKASNGNLRNNYNPVKKEDLERKYAEVETIGPPNEYCVFLITEGVMESLFVAIRNAFAHGSFNVKTYSGTRIYFLVNYKKYKKAQIVLQEETLLRWIDIIKAGPISS